MARVSKSKQIDLENEQQALAFFQRALRELRDPRRAQARRYPLQTVVVVALMAVICGCDNAEAMQLWGQANEEWLARFLPMPHGAPTQDVFLAVFAALDPKAFEAVLRSWATLLRARLAKAGNHIAIDGKTCRRSMAPAQGKAALHSVSAYLTDCGLVLGTIQTDAKSNEITAIPELLELLDLHGATVTIDAMGAQTKIVKTIVERSGNYVLSVKDNQPTLCNDIKATFSQARTAPELAAGALGSSQVHIDSYEHEQRGHGRLERRQVTVCRDLSLLTTAQRWTALDFVVEVIRQRTVLSTGRTSVEVAYYIGSDPAAKAASVAHTIRRHWAIENELHWVLDVGFREDESRHRAQNAAMNMATLRRFAVNTIKQDPTRKLGVANCRLRACLDRSYLLGLLKGPAEQADTVLE